MLRAAPRSQFLCRIVPHMFLERMVCIVPGLPVSEEGFPGAEENCLGTSGLHESERLFPTQFKAHHLFLCLFQPMFLISARNRGSFCLNAFFFGVQSQLNCLRGTQIT